VSKTPFKLWNGWKHNLNHTNVYDCLIEVRINNPQLKKLNPRTTSGYFIGYIVNYNGYLFSFSSDNTWIVKARNAKFLKNLNFNRSDFAKRIKFEETQYLHKDKRKLVIVQKNYLDNFEHQSIQGHLV
jgi:hypothetical protein